MATVKMNLKAAAKRAIPIKLSTTLAYFGIVTVRF